MKHYHFKLLRIKSKWLVPAYVGMDNSGIIQYLSDQKPENQENIEYINGAVLPGFQNAHSHAFQFGMAGSAEIHEPGTHDDFWSWREAMYQCALTFSPDEMKNIAVTLYRQMLKKGYTSVTEFHYVHHDKDGKPYNNLAELGEKLVEAASIAGIKITLIPVFYQNGNFNTAPYPRQRRFISPTLEDYFKLLESSKKTVKNYDKAKLGFGVHSLRAVNAEDIIETYNQGPKDLPFHVHAAEQLKEISDCQAAWGKRPVEWLTENLPLDERFHLIHCTHLTDEETEKLAKSKANVVLCPGTEGNLGDGIFRLKDYTKFNGNWSIGTDSHISLNPLEDLRWLDYAQRLTRHKRNTFDNGALSLIENSFFAGKRAMGETINDFFEVGQPFDAVVYDMNEPLLAQAELENLLPAIVYTADSSAVLQTFVDGKKA